MRRWIGKTHFALVLACASALAGATALAATKAVDGDTLSYDGITVQLWGIEAPDRNQTCADGWPAGRLAADYLAKLVEGHKIVCETKTTPQPAPVYALCRADGKDLSGAMVGAGMAWANLKQSDEYSIGETNAMVDLAGVHAHRCLKAEEWRAQHGGK